MDPEKNETLANDRLRGVGPISNFIGEPPGRTYYLLESGQLPAGKMGRSWLTSKAVLRAHYAKITNPPPSEHREEERTSGLAPPRRGRPRKTTNRSGRYEAEDVGNPDLIGITGAGSRGSPSFVQPLFEEFASSPRIGGIERRCPLKFFAGLGPTDIPSCACPSFFADDGEPGTGIWAWHCAISLAAFRNADLSLAR